MKLIVRFFSFIFVLGFAGFFFIKKPDGTPWLSLNDLIPSKESISDTLGQVVPDQVVGGDGGKVSVYRWKDKEGNWQFSDTPPDNLVVEQILVSTDLNRDLAPAELELEDEPEAKPKSGKAVLIGDGPSLSPTTISPDKIGKLIDDANNVQNLMNDRQKQIDSALQ